MSLRDRMIIDLAKIGYSQEEIAAGMRIPAQRVKNLLTPQPYKPTYPLEHLWPSDIEATPRAMNALARAGITSLAHLKELGTAAVANQRGVGKLTLRELQFIIDNY